MSDKALAVVEPQPGQIETAAPSVQHRFTLQEMWQMSNAFAKSGMFGLHSPEQALSLLLIAQAEGIHPAKAMMEYHVIENKPSLKADAMLARHQRNGGKVNWVCRTDIKVTAFFSGPLGEVEITWDQARAMKAGLWGKQNFQRHPAQMLAARCTSEGVRAVNPAAIQGFYAPEELGDYTDETDSDPPPPAKQMPAPAPIPMPIPAPAAAPAENDSKSQPAATPAPQAAPREPEAALTPATETKSAPPHRQPLHQQVEHPAQSSPPEKPERAATVPARLQVTVNGQAKPLPLGRTFPRAVQQRLAQGDATRPSLRLAGPGRERSRSLWLGLVLAQEHAERSHGQRLSRDLPRRGAAGTQRATERQDRSQYRGAC